MPAFQPLQQLDEARRRLGRLLELAGAGPRTTAPCRVEDVARGVRLRSWDGGRTDRPVLLVVPAPIKRWYVWDLQPDVSVVRRCLAEGMRVSLAEWTDVGPAGGELGLEHYADRLLGACIEVVERRTGSGRVLLAGHSLGGTLAAMLAARRPGRVAGLVLLEAPLGFGADTGAFAPLVAAAPHAGWMRRLAPEIPGSLLDAISVAASPREFLLERYGDLLSSSADRAELIRHLRVERWTLDELALPARLFEEIVERLYRRDELAAGTLVLAGRRIGPSSLTAPLLAVVDPTRETVPAESTVRFVRSCAARETRVLRAPGETGVALQHLGVLVGPRAHAELWPEIVGWMRDVWTSAGA